MPTRCEASMPDRVDAAVQTMKTAKVKTVLDRAVG
jgi:hypothetical protein